jgi:hypothetical protein
VKLLKVLLILTLFFLNFITLMAQKSDTRELSKMPKGYNIPIIDLAHETHRQFIVDKEPGQYLGHPTTVLLEDNKTMIIVYPKGHGRGAIVMKKSEDGGFTWSDRLPVPENWATSMEVPTIFPIIDNKDSSKLVLFSGKSTSIRMATSEDNGKTWTPLKSIGNWSGIVTMSSIVKLKDGNFMALFHDNNINDFLPLPRKGQNEQAKVVKVYKTISSDGGLNWSYPELIAEHASAHLCEPGAFRSPDGKQIAVLLRENSRQFNSFVIFSNDEGRTWTKPRELPTSLTGDRHVAKYAPDGRLFITFRDKAKESPTYGDWVGWIGTYDDIINGNEGQYRVRLKDNLRGSDCAYPGLELLADGTFVTTTYGHWNKGEYPFIISVRFKLEEIDDKAKKLPFKKAVFQKGKEGYINYRIPSLLVTQKGTLLAFCEGREAGDTGDIDLLLKRSEDGGKTWGEYKIVWDDSSNTCGNPCPVLDANSGTIWLLMTHNLGEDNETEIIHKKSKSIRTVWVCKSEDDGKNWSQPINITKNTKDPSWGWYATGPGVGIQIKYGSHKNRLVIPCDHSYDDPKGNRRGGPYEYGSHIIYSDDFGETWNLGGIIRPAVNECQLVELDDGKGSLLINMRSYAGRKQRAQAISNDGGMNWSEPTDNLDLIEPVCQASIIRYSWSEKNTPGMILFSNPANRKKRDNLTIRLSQDDGNTWHIKKTINFSPSAYSCLAVLPDNTVGLLYEAGRKRPYEKIVFAKFTIDWIINGKKSSIMGGYDYEM